METPVDLKIFHPFEIEGLRRVGNKNDGGYVVHFPSLQQVDCLVNYGVGYDVEFEKEFNKLTGKPVYAFDPTMKKLTFFIEKIKAGQFRNLARQIVYRTRWFAEERQLKKYKINFIEEGLSEKNADLYKRFDYHLSKYHLEDKNIFLKIDIEGGEYEILNDDTFYEKLGKVMQLAIEFHYIGRYINELEKIIKKLQRTHTIIHIHANNIGGTFLYNDKKVPEVLEFAFIHNSLLPNKALSSSIYPVEGLDYPCNGRKEDIPVDFFR